MKSLFISIVLASTISVGAHAEINVVGEIGYPNGSIGYEALVAGDNQRAIDEILSNNRISRHDPARLINLGQAYARTGRINEARAMFNAALEKRDQIDLVLADGRVMNSKDAASLALSKLQSRMASR